MEFFGLIFKIVFSIFALIILYYISNYFLGPVLFYLFETEDNLFWFVVVGLIAVFCWKKEG